MSIIVLCNCVHTSSMVALIQKYCEEENQCLNLQHYEIEHKLPCLIAEFVVVYVLRWTGLVCA